MRFTTLLLDANCIKIAGSQWSKAMVDVPIRVWRHVKTINKINIHCMRVFTSRSWPHYCLYWMFLENICIYSHAIGLVTHMLDCPDLPMDAHQRGFRSGYTECRLMKKWVYAVYLRIPSTTPLIICPSTFSGHCVRLLWLGCMFLHIVFNKLYSIWKHELFDRYLQSQFLKEAETEESYIDCSMCSCSALDNSPPSCAIHREGLSQDTEKPERK